MGMKNLREGDSEVKIKTDQDEVEINSEDGVGFPADFPSDFSIYENTKLTSSVKTTSEGRNAYSRSFELVGDWKKEAADFYQDTLPDTDDKIKGSIKTHGG